MKVNVLFVNIFEHIEIRNKALNITLRFLLKMILIRLLCNPNINKNTYKENYVLVVGMTVKYSARLVMNGEKHFPLKET